MAPFLFNWFSTRNGSKEPCFAHDLDFSVELGKPATFLPLTRNSPVDKTTLAKAPEPCPPPPTMPPDSYIFAIIDCNSLLLATSNKGPYPPPI